MKKISLKIKYDGKLFDLMRQNILPYCEKAQLAFMAIRDALLT